jgi:hypothetical protein
MFRDSRGSFRSLALFFMSDTVEYQAKKVWFGNEVILTVCGISLLVELSPDHRDGGGGGSTLPGGRLHCHITKKGVEKLTFCGLTGQQVNWWICKWVVVMGSATFLEIAVATAIWEHCRVYNQYSQNSWSYGLLRNAAHWDTLKIPQIAVWI